MTEPLTDVDRERLLASVGYTPDVDDEPEVKKTVEIVAPVPRKNKKHTKKELIPDVSPTDAMYDNDWQNTQFQARKATVGKGFTKEEAAVHNSKLWKELGDERMDHNRGVRTAQRELSGTGVMREVITAQRDERESVDDLVRVLRDLPEDQLKEALKRLK